MMRIRSAILFLLFLSPFSHAYSSTVSCQMEHFSLGKRITSKKTLPDAPQWYDHGQSVSKFREQKALALPNGMLITFISDFRGRQTHTMGWFNQSLQILGDEGVIKSSKRTVYGEDLANENPLPEMKIDYAEKNLTVSCTVVDALF